MSRSHRCLRLTTCVLLGSLLATVAPMARASAQLIDTGGIPAPGGYPFLNRNVNDLYFNALRFTLPFDATITGIHNMLGGYKSGGYTVTLAAGALNAPNDLFSFSTTANLTLVNGVDQGQWFGVNNLNWVVGAGTYWLKFTVPEGGLDGFMRTGAYGGSFATAVATAATNPIYGNFGDQSVSLRIDGFATRTVVPEPATWALMAVGLMLVFAFAARTGKQLPVQPPHRG